MRRLTVSSRIGFATLALCASLVAPACSQAPDNTPTPKISTAAAKVPLWGDYPNQRPSCVKGIHVTSWYAGTKKGRAKLEELLAETEINTVVIDIKESEGDVYVPGVKLGGRDNFVNAVPDLKAYVKFLKDRGVYVIARQTVFHDDKLAKWEPDWAIHSSAPLPKAAEKGFRKDVWVDRKGSAWGDAYNQNVWTYNIEIALKAADIGFQEIQFDYIRFPSDGPTKQAVYSQPHTSASAVKALSTFLAQAQDKLDKRGATLSIDVFGLVGSSKSDMGIGQKLDSLLSNVVAVSPMMYPSHYYAGEFGLKDPNHSPFETVHYSLRDTKRVLGEHHVELRPWLQDFSLGVKYGPKEVREQIEAAADLGIHEWLLWNPACRYTRGALHPFPGGLNPLAEPVSTKDEKTAEH